MTHPGSLPKGEGGGSYARYVHVSWDDKVSAIEKLHLPAPAMDAATWAYLAADLGLEKEVQ